MARTDPYSRRPLEARVNAGQAARSVPLSAGLSVLFGGFFTQFGSAFFAFGMVGCWVFMGQTDFAGAVKFMARTVNAEGQTLGSESTNAEVNEETVYRVRYSFVDAEGRTHRGESYTTDEVPRAGERVLVEYVTSDPATNRIVGHSRGKFPIWTAFVMLFPLIGGVMAYFGLREGRRKLRLLYFGQLARGKLVAKERTNTEINDRRVYELTFEFTTPDGRTGRISDRTHLTENLEDEPEELLLYDPRDPANGAAIDALPGGVKMSEAGEITQYAIARGYLWAILPVGAVVAHGIWAIYFVAR